jgi:uncharacterized protein (TIGR02266 family)
MLNISKGGMFIKTNSPHPLGTVLSLEFTLPGRKETIHATGLVVWHHKPAQTNVSSHEPGMGIKLTEINPHLTSVSWALTLTRETVYTSCQR